MDDPDPDGPELEDHADEARTAYEAKRQAALDALAPDLVARIEKVEGRQYRHFGSTDRAVRFIRGAEPPEPVVDWMQGWNDAPPHARRRLHEAGAHDDGDDDC